MVVCVLRNFTDFRKNCAQNQKSPCTSTSNRPALLLACCRTLASFRSSRKRTLFTETTCLTERLVGRCYRSCRTSVWRRFTRIACEVGQQLKNCKKSSFCFGGGVQFIIYAQLQQVALKVKTCPLTGSSSVTQSQSVLTVPYLCLYFCAYIIMYASSSIPVQ